MKITYNKYSNSLDIDGESRLMKMDNESPYIKLNLEGLQEEHGIQTVIRNFVIDKLDEGTKRDAKIYKLLKPISVVLASIGAMIIILAKLGSGGSLNEF